MSIRWAPTINMAGAAVTITVMTMAACQTIDLAVNVTAVIQACWPPCPPAASGVAGGSSLIPMCCALFGISNDVAMQVAGIGFIIGVIQDSCETGLNSLPTSTATASIGSSSRSGEVQRQGLFAYHELSNKLRAPRILNHTEGSLRAPSRFPLPTA
ncbi:MAG: hypothetical protein ACLSDQ_02655 [Adlercreutzia equolifaciens]